MIDFNSLNRYRENNRIEAKTALGGLPESIWETYSAFANTLGGLILLGVEEAPDRSLHTVDLPHPQELIDEFRQMLNDPHKVSVNIMSAGDIYSLEVDGDRIVVIDVPRADRRDRPVYVEGSTRNTYRRNGEGDYRCTAEEFEAMVRDASVTTPDMKILQDTGLNVVDTESLHGYRRRMEQCRPGHVFEQLDDETFLESIGGAGTDEDGMIRPTAAGLLMFGRTNDIEKEYDGYQLEYREIPDPETYSFDSRSGDWSGNVYDFYFRVYERLRRDTETPSEEDGDPVGKALREALANCLVNADYYGNQGVTVTRSPGMITMENPGNMRVEPNAALSGGVSDPRNSALQRMFSLIDIGERTGSGIPNIFRVWREEGLSSPKLTELIEPDRTVLTLPLTVGRKPGEEQVIRADEKQLPIRDRIRNSIIQFLTDQPSGTVADIALSTGMSNTRIRTYLRELVEDGIVVTEGVGGRSRIYKLKR